MTSCSNKSQQQITLCIQVGRLVAATCCGDYGRNILLHVCWRIFGKSLSLQHNFVSTPSHTNSVWFEFFWHVTGAKILLWRQRFSQKFSSTLEVVTNLSPTCHLGSVPIFRVNCAFCTFFPWAIGCAKVGKIPSCQLYLITITDILTAWLCQDSKWIAHCKLVVSRIILVIAWLGNVELGVIGPLQVC